MKTVFQCDHCGHVSSLETDMGMHEAECSYNPACRACDTCEHAFEEGGVFGYSPACKKGVLVSGHGYNSNCEQWQAQAPSEDELRRAADLIDQQ